MKQSVLQPNSYYPNILITRNVSIMYYLVTKFIMNLIYKYAGYDCTPLNYG